MGGEQFHISIYGGSKIIGQGRDFLREQASTLNSTMNDFIQCCNDEKEAFEQSVNSMENQCHNSARLAEEAERLPSKAQSKVFMAGEAYDLFFSFINEARSMVNEATHFLTRANEAIENHRKQLIDIKQKLEYVQLNIDNQNSAIENAMNEIKDYETVYDDSIRSRNYVSADGALRSIDSCKARIEGIREPFLRQYMEEKNKLESEKAEHEEGLAFARQIKASSEAALAAAQAHLQFCQQKVAEAKALKQKACALEQKAHVCQDNANKSSSDDVEKLAVLKQRANESAQILKELADNSLKVQCNTSENLLDNASIMDKLAELMYEYETYSISGGIL